MRIVGPNRDHCEIELDPVQAHRRGRVLDAMLRSGVPPIERGVRRATPAAFQAQDEARARMIARRINSG